MDTKLRELHPSEYIAACNWAIAEQWPGLVKGSVLTHEEFPKILSLPSHFSFAMSEKGSLAFGFGQIWLSPNGKTNLVRILVAPAMRGKGLGKRLCALLLTEALRMPNVKLVSLRVRRNNLPAVAVYRSIGFHELEAESNADVLAMAYAVKPVEPTFRGKPHSADELIR